MKSQEEIEERFWKEYQKHKEFYLKGDITNAIQSNIILAVLGWVLEKCIEWRVVAGRNILND